MSKKPLHSVISGVLGAAAVVFVLLLAGFGSGALTDPPPAVSPYAAGPSATTTTAAAPATTAAAATATTAAVGSGTSEVTTTTAPPAAAAQITIESFSFGEAITAAVGETVTVLNADGASHTWTSADGAFDSGRLAGGESFSFEFDAPGTYRFMCSFHASMGGSITITE